MGAVVLQREESLPVGYMHPRELNVSPLASGSFPLMRVDHPAADPIRDGAADLGWEGDPRLQLYLDCQENRWVLIRLERDGAYRATCVSGPNEPLNPEYANKMIRQVMSWDTRRGVDVVDKVNAHNDSIQAALDAKHADHVENDVAPRLAAAIRKDLGAHF